MPEVKVYPLIDSPMMLCNQPRRLSRDYTGVKNWLLSYSVDLPCVIHLGMNTPRPWKCPRTCSKKRKKRTKNENAAMSEQAKVGGKLKLRLWDQACKRSSRELRIERRCNDIYVLSGWLAPSYPIRRAFLHHIS